MVAQWVFIADGANVSSPYFIAFVRNGKHLGMYGSSNRTDDRFTGYDRLAMAYEGNVMFSVVFTITFGRKGRNDLTLKKGHDNGRV